MYKTECAFTKEQLDFLEIFHIAAKYDCLYVLDFYCSNEFDHDQVSALTDAQRAHLAELAQEEIFATAIKKGFRPDLYHEREADDGRLC
ncbi:MAG: hypothetical protein AAFX90_19630 [Pseudomonadota bacterium]